MGLELGLELGLGGRARREGEGEGLAEHLRGSLAGDASPLRRGDLQLERRHLG